MRCCMPGCGQRSEKGISFHKFPQKDPARAKEWLNTILKFLSECQYERKIFAPKKNTVICSKHFTSEDYIPVQDGRFMLKNSACPSVFLCDPNAGRLRRSKECVTNLVPSALRTIAPKPIINIQIRSATNSLLPEASSATFHNNNLAAPSTSHGEIESQEPDGGVCTTPTRKIIKVQTPTSQDTAKSDSPKHTVESDVCVTTQVHNDTSEYCTNCLILERENETLKEKILALEKLVSSLKTEREQSQTPTRCMETETQKTPSVCDVDKVFGSTPKSSRRPDHSSSSNADSLPFLQKVCALDHRYESTPRSLKRKLQSFDAQKQRLSKKARLTEKKLKRTQVKVEEMKHIIETLVQKVDLRPEVAKHIEEVFGTLPLEIYKRSSLAHSTGKQTIKKQYSAALRAFAVTLHFYSPRAYNFVREQFGLSLPHTSTIRAWYREVQAEPGLTEDSFTALKIKAEEYSASNKKLYCAMMFDDMHLKKQVEWDGSKYHGFCNVNNNAGRTESEIEAATQALVIMVVGLDGSWKVPLGYFFHNGLSSHEIADLVVQCMERLYSIGIQVPSLTFDGPSTHFAMARILGANLALPNLESSFPHPCDATIPVYCLLDPCHVLKLVRNAWSDSKQLYDIGGCCISWRFIEALHKIQNSEGLRAGNKLKKSHLQWKKSPMKVNLAAQTISASVADAIDFCRDAGMDDFKDSEATTHFIRVIDRWFDIMNSRNPLGRGFKAPLSTGNECSWRPFLHETMNYITSLRFGDGKTCVNSPKKTGFIGVVASCESMMAVFDRLVLNPDSDTCFKYLLTYKLSQDHLELFFNAIRARGGWCVNPSPRQFTSAYKRLLVRHQIKAANGNVNQLDKTSILFATRSSVDRYQDTVAQIDTLGTALDRAYSIEGDPTNEARRDNCDNLDALPSNRLQVVQNNFEDTSSEMPPDFFVLSEFAENSVALIAGYVVRMVFKRVKCLTCCGVLCSGQANDNRLRLILQKTNGGLIFPSPDVLKICSTTEILFRRVTRGIPPTASGFNHSVANMVFAELADKNLFVDLNDHMFDTSAEENHMFNLIKTIALCYIRIKMYHTGKNYTETISDVGKRKKLSRLAIFLNV